MKGCISETETALYIGGDCDSVKLRQIQLHLADCEACRELVAEFCESQLALKDDAREFVCSAAPPKLRDRIIGEIRAVEAANEWKRRLELAFFQRFKWKYALAGAALFVLMGIGVWRFQQRGSDIAGNAAPPPVMAAPAPQVEAASLTPSTVPIPPKRKRPTARPKTDEVAEPRQQITFKLVTDNPDIQIYWLLDSDGGQL